MLLSLGLLISAVATWSKAIPKLGDLSPATLYSGYLSGWLNMRVTS